MWLKRVEFNLNEYCGWFFRNVVIKNLIVLNLNDFLNMDGIDLGIIINKLLGGIML